MARDPFDRYYTPDLLARRCVECIGSLLSGAVVIEPSVGDGAWLRALDGYVNITTVACDVDPHAAGLQLVPPERRWLRDWLDVPISLERPGWRLPPSSFRVVLGNPPYRHAEAHLRHAARVVAFDGGYGVIGFVLKLPFLATVGRRKLFAELGKPLVWVLRPRPSFTGTRTDRGAEYAFMLWKVNWSPLVLRRPDYDWLDWR